MTKKGVAAYRKANPGSKLQTAVTEDNPTGARAARRKSFCARSEGQMIRQRKLQCARFHNACIPYRTGRSGLAQALLRVVNVK